jgi:hypothetical protein
MGISIQVSPAEDLRAQEDLAMLRTGPLRSAVHVYTTELSWPISDATSTKAGRKKALGQPAQMGAALQVQV